MKKIIKKIIPKSIYFKSAEFFLYQKYKKLLKDNKKLKNQYKGKRCFIIGNGTSINKMNLNLLRNEYVFAMNYFYNYKDFFSIKPSFFSCIEPINSNPNFTFNHFKELIAKYDKIGEVLPEMIFFFNISYQNYIIKNNLFKNNHVCYLKSLFPLLQSRILQDDISRPHSFMDGSIYNAIACCVYMGFKIIYFLGCDCDWFSNKGATHFYDEKKREMESSNNEKLFYNNYLTLKKWRLVTNYFKSKNVQIINCGVGGDNDICDRINFQSLF